MQPQRAPHGASVHDERHRHEQATLYRLVQAHAATFFEQTESAAGCQPAAVRQGRVRRHSRMRHPGLRLPAAALRRLRPRQAAWLQLQASRLLPVVRGQTHSPDGCLPGRPCASGYWRCRFHSVLHKILSRLMKLLTREGCLSKSRAGPKSPTTTVIRPKIGRTRRRSIRRGARPRPPRPERHRVRECASARRVARRCCKGRSAARSAGRNFGRVNRGSAPFDSGQSWPLLLGW